MGKLKVLADGKSTQARASARGKLFEKLMGEVLRHYGYSIDRIANVNYAGMEIDIDGRNTVTGTPLYAECKCQESEVTSPKLQECGSLSQPYPYEEECNGHAILFQSRS